MAKQSYQLAYLYGRGLRISLGVDAKNDPRAVDALVREGVGGPVVEVGVQQALGAHSQALPLHLPVEHLHCHLVPRDFELLHPGSDHFAQLLGDVAAAGRVIGAALQPLVKH